MQQSITLDMDRDADAAAAAPKEAARAVTQGTGQHPDLMALDLPMPPPCSPLAPFPPRQLAACTMRARGMVVLSPHATTHYPDPLLPAAHGRASWGGRRAVLLHWVSAAAALHLLAAPTAPLALLSHLQVGNGDTVLCTTMHPCSGLSPHPIASAAALSCVTISDYPNYHVPQLLRRMQGTATQCEWNGPPRAIRRARGIAFDVLQCPREAF
jgi:hypothetical protein